MTDEERQEILERGWAPIDAFTVEDAPPRWRRAYDEDGVLVWMSDASDDSKPSEWIREEAERLSAQTWRGQAFRTVEPSVGDTLQALFTWIDKTFDAQARTRCGFEKRVALVEDLNLPSVLTTSDAKGEESDPVTIRRLTGQVATLFEAIGYIEKRLNALEKDK